MKFSEIPYERFDKEAYIAFADKLTADMREAKSAEAASAIIRQADDWMKELYTLTNIVYVRNTIDTNDKFYEAEREFCDDAEPEIQEHMLPLIKAAVDSPFRGEMEKEYGSLLFENYELQLKAMSPAVIEDMKAENQLAVEYGKILAKAQIEFEGKTLTLPQLGFYKQSEDRGMRKKAFEASSAFFDSHKEEFDDIYDKLVKNRDGQAKKLGYENYIGLGYCRMQRNSWNASDVEKFRQLVRSELIPVVCKLKEAQAKRLGIDRIHFYDDAVMFPDGNTKPKGTPDEIFAAGKKMYTDMSKETAEFFDFMLEHDLFDVLSKKGKHNGGYCTSIPKYGFPFIFANFNGTTDDIDVLTHEAGHAFADYRANRIPGLLAQLQNPTFEACEVHSMSMEFFAWKYMDLLVEDADKYRISHLTDAFSFIPYGTIVDEFQHIAYGNPNLTPAERNRAYLDLEKQYRPYIDLSDSPFINEGRRWQYQSHIYERPFYYIDYCFAQITALYFRSLTQENYAAAWEKYIKYVSFAGTKRFTDMLGGAGLPSPFEKATFDAVVRSTLEFLGE